MEHMTETVLYRTKTVFFYASFGLSRVGVKESRDSRIYGAIGTAATWDFL